MNRGFLHGAAALALLGAAAACAGGSQKETGMVKSDAVAPETGAPLWSLGSFQSGSLVLLPDSGQGSGGHLTADSGQGSGGHLIANYLCHYDANGVLVCKAVADSGQGSGGHRAALLMDCISGGPGREIACTAPVRMATE